MPNLGVNSTHGQQTWAQFILERLSHQSALLRGGARFIPIAGRVAHIPRVLTDGQATWEAEGDEIDSNAPTGDELFLTPKKLANVVSLSNESIADAPVSELDAVGNAMTRSVAVALDARAFSATAASAIAPAGLRSVTLPTVSEPISVDSLIEAVGKVGEVGGIATTIWINPTDLTALRLLKDGTGSERPLLTPDVSEPGAETVAGAVLVPTPALPAGVALVAEAPQVVVGVREDVQVEFSEHAKFTADSTVARVVARADWGLNDSRGVVVVADV